MEITSENVQVCWAYYEGYKQAFYKRHFKNVEIINFEEWVAIELAVCPNCGEIVLKDELVENGDLDGVCQQCIEDGYYE